MERCDPPSTPTRQAAFPSPATSRAGAAATDRQAVEALQSTPAAPSVKGPSTSTLGEPSFNTSSGEDGSIVIHSLSSVQNSGSGLESSFEALELGHARHPSTDSSLEIIVHSSPGPSTGFLAFSGTSQGTQTVPPVLSALAEPSAGGGGPQEERHSRRSSLVAIDEKKELALLNPVAREFSLPTPKSSTLSAVERIILFGKDEYGQLTTESKEALARLGLKPVPSLHGPLNLPYARCASGIDAFIASDNPDGEPWGDDGQAEGGHPQRTHPIPLPGNSRYTQAGRLAMRYASAPATLESGGRRSHRAVSSSRSPLPSKSKKSSSPARQPASSPSQTRQQQSKNAKQEPSPTTLQQQVSNFPTQSAASLAQLEIGAQAFARAQAMHAFFIQQAHLAQALGSQATADFLAAQPGSSVGPNASSPRAQSPLLPPFQPFSPPANYASPPLLQQVDHASSQVDSLTLLKLAGQRQLGLNFPFPPPPPAAQVNLLRPESSTSPNPGIGINASDEALGGRQAERDASEDGSEHDRSAVPLSTTGPPGGTGYDFLRRQGSGTSQHRQQAGSEGLNRRNSSSTRIEQHGRAAQLAKPPQESRRRRSAAPAVPYPGHSIRKASTSSSVVTVNSSVVPQVRIFSDSSSPTQRRRSTASTSNGRPLEELVNTPQVLASKSRRFSAAENSSNWRNPATLSAGQEPKLAGSLTSHSHLEPVSTPSQIEPDPHSGRGRGHGRGGKGRKRGGRGGGSKPRSTTGQTVIAQSSSSSSSSSTQNA
ncbi:hypothetical protein JCM11491_006256 [Sporobolomyces phaffii]